MTADQLPLEPPPDEYDHAGPPPDWDYGNLPPGQHPDDRIFRPGPKQLAAGAQNRAEWADIVGRGTQGTHDPLRPGDSLGSGMLFTEAVPLEAYPGDPAAWRDQLERDNRIRARRAAIDRRLHRLPLDTP